MIDPSQSRRAILGTIKRIRFNDAYFWDDGDLNLFIKPASSFEDILINSAGRRNDQCRDTSIEDGWIETEIKTVNNGTFEQLFQPNMNVAAYGWWVEDEGHCDKTELHPIIYLIGSSEANPLRASQFSLFVGQDWSERFAVSEERLARDFYINMSTDVETVHPDQNRTHGGPDAMIVREESWLDHERTDGDSRHSSNARANFVTDQPAIKFHFSLGPKNGSYKPVYLARFWRHPSPIFRDNVQYSVTPPGPNGFREVEITIQGEFEMNSLVTSQWQLSSSDPLAPPEYLPSEVGTHMRRFTRRYAPARGLNETTWALIGIGRDHRFSDLPPLTTGESGTRNYVRVERRYAITPSSLRLAVPKPQPPAQRPTTAATTIGRQVDRPRCGKTETLIAEEHLLPNVGLVPGTFKWRVRKLQTFAGVRLGEARTAAGPSISTNEFRWHEISATMPLDRPEYKITVDPLDNHKLTVDWKTYDLLFKNTVIEIEVSAQSELGEALLDRVINPARCVPPTTDVVLWFNDILKGQLAIIGLQEKGLIPRAGERLPGFPQIKFSDDPAHEVTKWLAPLRDDNRNKGEAFAKYIQGYFLSEEDGDSIKELAKQGASLSWNRAPSGAEFNSVIRQFSRQLEMRVPVVAPVRRRTEKKY